MKELLKAKSEFRQKGVVLKADKQKQGGGGSWNFAGEDNFIKTIQAPLSECGLEYVAVLRAMPELNLNMVVATLMHIDSGEYIESSKILNDPEPKKDRNGNPLYLDAEIESGKQFGYWSRILGIRLLGLSDIDPEDVQNIPQQIIKSYNTWSKSNEQEKLVNKKEFMDLCGENSVDSGDIQDFLDFVNPGMKENEKYNEIVHFLRKPELLADQIESYKGWKAKGN